MQKPAQSKGLAVKPMASDGDKYIGTHQYGLYLKNILRKIFLEDWLMKVVALIITLALWVGVTGSSKPTSQRMNGVPLTLRYSNDTEVTRLSDEEISFSISGDKRKIDLVNMTRNDLTVTLDLTDLAPGDHTIPLTPQSISVSVPTGVKIDEISPRGINVRIERVEEKEVPVNAATEGDVGEGMEVYSETVTPQKIRVRGPSSVIRSLSSVTTEKIDLTNKTSDFIAHQISVNVSNPKATLLDTVVDVAVRIGEKRIEKTYRVPVKEDPKRKATVVLFGGKSLFDSIKPEDLRVDIVKAPSGEETPQVTLPASLQNNVEVRRVKPDR